MTSFNHGSRSRYQADLCVRLELCPLSDMASDLQWIKAEKKREEKSKMCGLTKVLTLSWLLSVKLPTAVYGGKRDGVSTVRQLEANKVKEERSGKRISTYLFKACSAFAFIIHILQIDIEHVNNGYEW
jgi:hypothetical protein